MLSIALQDGKDFIQIGITEDKKQIDFAFIENNEINKKIQFSMSIRMYLKTSKVFQFLSNNSEDFEEEEE
jgi:hypothetical protein